MSDVIAGHQRRAVAHFVADALDRVIGTLDAAVDEAAQGERYAAVVADDEGHLLVIPGYDTPEDAAAEADWLETQGYGSARPPATLTTYARLTGHADGLLVGGVGSGKSRGSDLVRAALQAAAS